MNQVDSKSPSADVVPGPHQSPQNLQSNGVAVGNILSNVCLNLTQPECTDRWH